MSLFVFNATANATDPEKGPRWQDQFTNQRDLGVQVVISVALGLSAFIAFCVCAGLLRNLAQADGDQILRPKWSELYNARKKQAPAAARLPDLPKTMFGWIPVLYGITDVEVLASAGLDAYAVCLLRFPARLED